MTTETKKRFTIADVRREDSESLYVYNRASKVTRKAATHLMLPHTSASNGDTKTIELPMTFIPIDLSSYAPKDELIKNGDFLRMLASGIIEFCPVKTAEELIETSEGMAEMDRLESDRLRRYSGQQPEVDTQNNIRTVMPPELAGQRAAPGTVDLSTSGVQPSVVAAISQSSVDDGHRLSLIRNLVPTMSEADKAWVRGNTTDSAIRKLVA